MGDEKPGHTLQATALVRETSDPASLGKPTRDYVALRLTEYMGVHGPLVITYTIHWDVPEVFVGRCPRIVRWAGF
jgi:hypothetical protein